MLNVTGKAIFPTKADEPRFTALLKIQADFETEIAALEALAKEKFQVSFVMDMDRYGALLVTIHAPREAVLTQQSLGETEKPSSVEQGE